MILAWDSERSWFAGSAQFPHLNVTYKRRTGAALGSIWHRVSKHLVRSVRLKLLNDLVIKNEQTDNQFSDEH